MKMRPLILCSVVLSSSALAMQAQPSGQQTADPWQGLAVLLAIVAIVQRKAAIGGWLLYFFGSLYLRSIATVYNVFKYMGVYSPAAWHDVTRYLLFLNSTVPGYLFPDRWRDGGDEIGADGGVDLGGEVKNDSCMRCGSGRCCDRDRCFLFSNKPCGSRTGTGVILYSLGVLCALASSAARVFDA